MKARIIALIVGAAAILMGALLLAGVSPIQTLQTLIAGSLGKPAAITGTLRETTPLLIAGAAVYFGLRAGLFNIGVEGQLLVGAAAAAATALAVPGGFGLALGCVTGSIAGALWAWPAGWIRAYRNGHEVITTIMLNNVAVLLTGWLTAGPMKAPGQESPTSALLKDRLPSAIQEPFTINLALIFGILIVIVMAYWLKRTVPGYEMEAVAANETAAKYAGVETRAVMMKAMLTSGAIAGFGGAMQVIAYEGRFYAGFSPGYGFDALGVALLAGNSAMGVLPASLLFGILAKGSTALQIDGVPKGLTTVILGLLIFIAAAIRYRRFRAVA